MRTLEMILDWIYPAVYIFLAIFCLLKIKRRGAMLLFAGFTVLGAMSLAWRLSYFINYNGIIYTTLRYLSLAATVAFAVLFVLGISSILGIHPLGSQAWRDPERKVYRIKAMRIRPQNPD